MYRMLDKVVLKNGEKVEAGVVIGPDADWADRVYELLGHKGETWRWGNDRALRDDLGLDALFYVLHRDGEPFTNMMNIEYHGVGLYGHVYTKPDERRNGAASALMLLLGTEYDTHPYHLYAKNGFVGLEPESGTMAYYTESEEEFYDRYFAADEATVETLDWPHWPHWPGAISLFAGKFAGTVRSMVMRVTDRYSIEGPMIPLIRDGLERPEMGLGTGTSVLRLSDTGAVAGLATYGPNPIWRGSWTVDVYCHPDYWDRGTELCEAIEIQPAERLLAYCDTGFEQKERVLRAAGFEPIATYKDRVAVDVARTRHVDVTEWERGN